MNLQAKNDIEVMVDEFKNSVSNSQPINRDNIYKLICLIEEYNKDSNNKEELKYTRDNVRSDEMSIDIYEAFITDWYVTRYVGTGKEKEKLLVHLNTILNELNSSRADYTFNIHSNGTHNLLIDMAIYNVSVGYSDSFKDIYDIVMG